MKIYFIFFTLFCSALIGCEKELKLTINNPTPKMVIEASITEGNGPFYVKISNSKELNNNEKTILNTKAEIVIKDDSGQIDTLFYNNSGAYQTKKLKGFIGRTYYISVKMDNVVYSAVNKIPSKIKFENIAIDSIVFNGTKVYTIIPKFTSPLLTDNYYRFIQRINDTIDNTYFLFNGIQGEQNNIPLLSINSPIKIKKNDIISIEMQCITQKEFEYFSVLSQQSNFGINANTAPSNPKSNFSGDILGFFSCHTSEYKTIEILK
jgi:hypothetical protein